MFLNSNPNTQWRKNWVGLFDIILTEEPFKGVLMTNEVIKNSLHIENDIATKFFAKLASVIGFQYNLPINIDNPFVDVSFERNIEHVKGYILLLLFITHTFSCTKSSSAKRPLQLG